jgi:endonuclease-3
VDTHIFRIGNRTGLAPGKTPREVEAGLVAAIPKRFMRHAHHWLILHGRYVCKARKPECWRCDIVDLCQFREKTPAPDAVTKWATKKPAKRLAAKPKLLEANPGKKALGK